MKPCITVFLIALVCVADSDKTDNGLVKQNSETSDDPAVHDVGIAGIPYPGALYPAAANALYPAAKYPAALYGGAAAKAVYPAAAKAVPVAANILYPAVAKAVYPAAAKAVYPAAAKAVYPAAAKAVYPAAAKAVYPAAAKAVYPAAANILYPAAAKAVYPAAAKVIPVAANILYPAAAKAVYPAAPLYGAGAKGQNAGLAPYYKDSEDLLTIRDDQLHENAEETGRSNEQQNTVPSKISLRSSDPMENENTPAASRQADNTSDHFAKTAGNSGCKEITSFYGA